ncbi:MAG: anaerobic ribonucleoside-triphosphate reductase activating protein [Mailhella sp.]|nr:anaerobic ribonucleoside-triphosphate reductase activating protein [Mailhella sp.]
MKPLNEVQLRVAGVIEESIVDGPGLRFALFLQGCPIHCPGCQNPQTWDPEGGSLVTADEVLARILADPLVHGVTFSGGEPFAQAEALLPLACALKERGYNLMAFTGYTLEKLVQDPSCRALLEKLDLLVDGPFIEAQKSLELRFRGSLNQRIINMLATRANGWSVVLDELNEAVER